MGLHADRKAALVRYPRMRIAAIPGVAAITSARAPDDDGSKSRRLTQSRTTVPEESTRYFTTRGCRQIILRRSAFRCYWAEVSIARQPTGALCHPQRIGRPAA